MSTDCPLKTVRVEDLLELGHPIAGPVRGSHCRHVEVNLPHGIVAKGCS
jgi:hypothetical protein